MRLTGMAGGARVASVRAVTGEGVPGLGTFTPVFTIAGQTPTRKQIHLLFPMFGQEKMQILALTCYSEMWY